MLWRTWARAAVVQLLRVGFRESHEFLQRLERLSGMRDEKDGHRTDHANRREIAFEIERQLGIERRVDGHLV
jgi:hypothetical protein